MDNTIVEKHIAEMARALESPALPTIIIPACIDQKTIFICRDTFSPERRAEIQPHPAHIRKQEQPATPELDLTPQCLWADTHTVPEPNATCCGQAIVS